jgi:HD-like signal output (HDOD) protein
LGLWGFNDNIVEAVAYHHRPSDAGPAASRVLTMVHAAQYLMRESSTVKVRREAFSPIDTEHLESVGLASHVPAWRGACEELVKEWSHG